MLTGTIPAYYTMAAENSAKRILITTKEFVVTKGTARLDGHTQAITFLYLYYEINI